MDEETTPLAQAQEPDVEEPRYLKIPAELAQILAGHQTWLDTSGKTGTQARLEGYDFAHLDLANVNLQRALLKKPHFKGANLSGANFRAAELQGAQFAQANLLKASLRDADLQEADLSGAENLTVSQRKRSKDPYEFVVFSQTSALVEVGGKIGGLR
jgi:uncharacterized protein YjbI with pentapeptide repeats